MPRIAPSKKSNPSVQGQENAARDIQQGILENAEVVDIIMDEGHPAWNPSQYRIIGSIQARAFPRQFGVGVESCGWYNPLFPNLRQYPLLGEIVLLIAAASRAAQLRSSAREKYYMSMPVGVWQGVNQNGLPASSYNINRAIENPEKNYRGFTGNPKGDANDLPFGEYFEGAAVPRLFPYEGDTIFEGRFGQGLRFGSGAPEAVTANDWSKDGVPGAPITILSNGLSTEDSAYHQENVNEDSAGIWLCDGQSVPIDVSSKLADSYATAFEKAEQEERSKIDPLPEGRQPDAGASSGANAEKNQGVGSTAEDNKGNPAPGDGTDAGDEAPTPAPEPDADIEEAVEELPEAGEFDAYVRGAFQKTITCVIIDGKLVDKAFADKVLQIKQDASKDGVTVRLNSGFRPMEVASGPGYFTDGQRTIRRKNVDRKYEGTKSGLSKPAGTADDGWAAQGRQRGYFSPLTAGPGYSKHQNGTAMDVQTGMPGDKEKINGVWKLKSLEKTPERITKTYKWLVANMAKYGMIRTVATERWHWEYHPGAGPFSRIARNDPSWDGLV